MGVLNRIAKTRFGRPILFVGSVAAWFGDIGQRIYRNAVGELTVKAATTVNVEGGATANTTEQDFKSTVVGKGFYLKEGTNATMGASALVGGTVTVSTTKVTTSSRIFYGIQALGTVAAPKAIAVTARVAGTSFTLTSADATDTSTIAWMIVEPS